MVSKKDRSTEITKTVGPSARGRQKFIRADKMLDPVGPMGRYKFGQTLTLSYYLFIHFRDLELTYQRVPLPRN